MMVTIMMMMMMTMTKTTTTTTTTTTMIMRVMMNIVMIKIIKIRRCAQHQGLILILPCKVITISQSSKVTLAINALYAYWLNNMKTDNGEHGK